MMTRSEDGKCHFDTFIVWQIWHEETHRNAFTLWRHNNSVSNKSRTHSKLQLSAKKKSKLNWKQAHFHQEMGKMKKKLNGFGGAIFHHVGNICSSLDIKGIDQSRCCHSIFKGVTMIVPQPRIWPLFRGVSSTFSAIFTPILHKTGTNWPLKNTPIFRIPSTLLLNHPYFRNFKYTFTKPPLFYKIIYKYIFFCIKKLFFFFFLKHITNKEKSSYGVNTQVGHTNH